MSIHRGTVINNVDPALRGRIQVRVPSVNGEAPSWAIPVLPLGIQSPSAAATAPIGADVWVTFEEDDFEHPVVLGLVPRAGGITPAGLAAELGHDDGDRPGRRVRHFLRGRYPDHHPNQRWLLTPDQANEVRVHFGRGGR